MIRILIFLVFIVAAAAVITWLSSLTGYTTMRIGSTVIDARSSVVVGLGVFLTLLVAGATLVLSGLVTLPKKIRRHREDSRREKGMIALTRGLEAVAAGDAVDAQRHARIANRQLAEPALTRLLTAQAAHLAGDEDTAQASFAAMLEAPETEFLGLRGLYLQAMTAGDRKEARGYAERAFRLRPGADWAYQSVYALSVDRGAWGDAREAIQLAQSHGLETGEAAKRKEAALLTAQAYEADNAEDSDTALRDAEAALKRAPGFAPAAVLAARLEAAAGRRSKGGRILDDAWSISPHPAIARTMADLYKDENVERRAARLKRLAQRRPDADESKLLSAEQDIALGDYQAAKEAIEPLLTRTPRARTFTAMARAVEGLYGRDAAQYWLDRAAAAPLDPVPGADGVFHFTTEGWQRLIREYGDHGRLAPPPLEDIHTGLTSDEIRLLAAPPEPVVTAEALDVEEPAAETEAEPAAEEAAAEEPVIEETEKAQTPDELVMPEAPAPEENTDGDDKTAPEEKTA